MQVDGMDAGAKRYRGMIHAFSSIVREEGVARLWRGAAPAVSRATVLAAVELASYDEVKAQLLLRGVIERGTVAGVFASSMCSGLLGAISSSPFDVVKSRLMGQPVDAGGRGLLYGGMGHCFAKVRLISIFSM
jgi:hypothetical protein